MCTTEIAGTGTPHSKLFSGTIMITSSNDPFPSNTLFYIQDTPISKMAAPRPAPVPRTRNRSRITAPELEQFVVVGVQLTGVTLGAGAYGSVEEVDIPGARVAAKKIHTQLINLGSPQQVLLPTN